MAAWLALQSEEIARALDEALRDSKAGKTPQKAYPAIRHGIPAVLAARRYRSR